MSFKHLLGRNQFVFGGNTGDTYESLQAKRRTAESFAKNVTRGPRNVGEGLSAIGQALMYRKLMGDVEAGEQQGRQEFNSAFQGLLAGQGAATPPAAPGSAPASVGSGDRDLLAKTLMAEAGGEGLEGMLAAGAVINNRVAAGGYGDGLSGVIMKPGQFSAWNGVTGYANGEGGLDMDNITPSQTAFQAADMLLSGQYADPTGGATHYYNPAAADPAWGQRAGGDWQRIGNHVFGFADAGRGRPATQSPESGVDPQLAQLAASPWASPEQKSVLGMLLQQQMQQADPNYQLQQERTRLGLERDQLELEQLRNPQMTPYQEAQLELLRQKQANGPGPTTDQQNYQFYVDQETEAGRQPLSYNDWDLQSRKAGGTNVTVNNTGDTPPVPAYPKAPNGYMYLRDPQSGQIRLNDQGIAEMAPIIGGPEDMSAKEEIATDRANTAGDVVTLAAQRAREAAEKQNFGPTGTSLVGALPWTDSAEVMRQVSVLKSQAAGSNLQQMRDASPTGGALGNVTEKELVLLQDLSGSLDPNSPTFLRDLDHYERTLLRTIHGVEAGDRLFNETRGGASQGFEAFAADPGAQAAAKQHGVTLEEMWAIKQGLN